MIALALSKITSSTEEWQNEKAAGLSSRPSLGEQAGADFAQVALLTLNSLPNFFGLLLTPS